MKKISHLLETIFITSLFIGGCGQAIPAEVEVTRIVKETVIVTQIVERVVTATPVPVTATPEVTATPKFALWTSAEVIQAFEDAGLEVTNPTKMTREDFGLAPYMTDDTTHFFIPSLCSDCGGRIFAFSDPVGLETTQNYYVALGEQSAAFDSWVFTKDNILVQINGDLDETKAKAYESTLLSLKK
jgi:hypothetical protein